MSDAAFSNDDPRYTTESEGRMRLNKLAIAATLAAILVPTISQAQGFFGFETVPFGTQTAFSETDAGTGVTASFSALSSPLDAFQVLDNLYPPGTPFYSFNMSHQVLIENTAGEHALQIHFDAMQKVLKFNFGLPDRAAQLIFEIPSLGISQTFSGADLQPSVSRDLPFEGTVLFNAGSQTFDTVQIHASTGTDEYGIDNVRVSSVPEGSSLLMFALGGIPVGAFVLRRKRQVRPIS